MYDVRSFNMERIKETIECNKGSKLFPKHESIVSFLISVPLDN